MTVIHVFLVSLISNLISANECNPVWRYQPEKIAIKQDTIHQNSTACVCSAEYCDDFVVTYPTVENTFLSVRSSQYQQGNETQPARFSQSFGDLDSTLPENTKTNYTVKSNKLQKIWGFGGALTDSTAILVAEQPSSIQNLILESYFSSDTGNGYSMIRTNMGGCDFSVRNYTYAETPGDFGLVDFELAVEDTEFKIPMLKRIYEFAGGSDKVKLYAAPWTAPNWMKTNNMPNGNGSIFHEPEYYQTWANYFVKYIQAYKAAGIQITQISLQNEPGVGQQGQDGWRWQQTYWSTNTQSEFLRDYVIPTFEANGVEDVTIQLFDGNRIELRKEAWPVAELSGVSAGAYGGNFQIAMHWYEDFLEVLGRGKTQVEIFEAVKQIHGDDVSMIGTEACMPLMSYPSRRSTYREASDDLGNWVHGDWYSRDIIENMKRGYSGWTDWNMVLDTTGGPNWAGNRHDAPIILDVENNLFYKNPMFYHMGHFSKFLDDTFYVLEAGNTGRNPAANDGDFHFFAASDDVYEVYVLLNSADHESGETWWETSTGKYLSRNVPPRSVETVVIKL